VPVVAHEHDDLRVVLDRAGIATDRVDDDRAGSRGDLEVDMGVVEVSAVESFLLLVSRHLSPGEAPGDRTSWNS